MHDASRVRGLEGVDELAGGRHGGRRVGDPYACERARGEHDSNVVHACIGNVSKIARVVGVSGACIASPAIAAETPAHWSSRSEG